MLVPYRLLHAYLYVDAKHKLACCRPINMP